MASPSTRGARASALSYADRNAPPTRLELRQAWENAGKAIDHEIGRDERLPELWDLLADNKTGSYSDAEAETAPLFVRTNVIVLPDALLEQYDDLEYKCFMGLFPEINRAWITIDNRIFLWNYLNGSDVVVYDGLDQIIITAGLVRPRMGVFVDEIQYVLVLVTPVEVVLLGLCFSDLTTFGDITIYPTQLSVPSDNINMLKVVGTEAGRVFLAGKDGNVYELLYQAEDGWFRRKCRKTNLTATPFVEYLPSFLQLFATSPIIDMVVDDTRNILYTLTDTSTISVYDLGENGNRNKLVIARSDLAKQVALENARLDPSMLRIVSIHPIPLTESRQVHLLAVTSSGIRIYLTTTDYRWGQHRKSYVGPPEMLVVVNVRVPPRPTVDANAAHHTPLMSDIHTTAYADGVTLMADTRSEDFDSVVGLAHDVTVLLQEQKSSTSTYGGRANHALTEDRATAVIEGKAWAIAEMPVATALRIAAVGGSASTSATGASGGSLMGPASVLPPRLAHYGQNSLSTAELYQLRQARAQSMLASLWDAASGPSFPARPVRNEFATQHVLPPRQFLCLTNTGMHVLTKLRPVDQLRALLESGSRVGARLQAFFNRYGADQACAMCLVLACSPAALGPSPLTAGVAASFGAGGSGGSAGGRLGNRGGIDVRQAAASAYFRLGGEPHVDEPQSTTGGAMGRTVAAPKVVYSGAHTGLYLYLARLLRPIWSANVTVTPVAGQFGAQESAFTQDELVDLQRWLSALQAFLRSQKNFADRPRGAGATVYQDTAAAAAAAATTMGGSLRQRVVDLSSLSKLEEARKQEQQSLFNATVLLERCVQALAFLELLCGQRFDDFVPAMDATDKSRLAGLTFKALVTSTEAGEVVRAVITAVMKQVTKGGRGIEAVANRMRDRCPDFFSQTDMLRHQGFELLHVADTESVGPAERERALNTSLRLFLDSAETIHLRAIVDTYKWHRFYTGVVELALATAYAADPSEIALRWYIDGSPGNDSVAKDAWDKRMKCYGCVLEVFDELSRPLPKFNALDERPPTTEEAKERARSNVLQVSLAADDELFHATLYTWFIDTDRRSELLELGSPFLENFLRRDAAHVDLLWQYYVRNRAFQKAALILGELAKKEGQEYNLERRKFYLSRAITNAKSATSDTVGEFLYDLEEKMEVVAIQVEVHAALTAMASAAVDGAAQAVDELDARLMTISELFNDYCHRFDLWETKLACLATAGYEDEALVKSIWKEVIAGEVARLGQQEYTFEALSIRMEALGARYYGSDKIFPLLFITSQLEWVSFKYGNLEAREGLPWHHDWVVVCLFRIGVPFPLLLEVYTTLYEAREKPWVEDNRPHLLWAISAVLRHWHAFVLQPQATAYDRQVFNSQRPLDQIPKFLANVATMGADGAALEEAFRELLPE